MIVGVGVGAAFARPAPPAAEGGDPPFDGVLLANGGYDADEDWFTDPGAAIGGGVLTITGEVGVDIWALQLVTLTAGFYVVSFDIVARPSGSIKWEVGPLEHGSTTAAAGTRYQVTTSNPVEAGTLNFRIGGRAGDGVELKIDNVRLEPA